MSSGQLSFGHNRIEGTLASDQSAGSIDPRLQSGIERSRDYLLNLQTPEGYWCAELQGDTILESEYILLLAFLGQGQSERAKEAAAYMLDQQGPHGGWSMFPGGPLEISGSVKAYLALKITGHDPDRRLHGARTRSHPEGRRRRRSQQLYPGSIWRCWGSFPTTFVPPCHRK